LLAGRADEFGHMVGHDGTTAPRFPPYRGAVPRRLNRPDSHHHGQGRPGGIRPVRSDRPGVGQIGQNVILGG
jgi:hypothetical protein